MDGVPLLLILGTAWLAIILDIRGTDILKRDMYGGIGVAVLLPASIFVTVAVLGALNTLKRQHMFAAAAVYAGTVVAYVAYQRTSRP